MICYTDFVMEEKAFQNRNSAAKYALFALGLFIFSSVAHAVPEDVEWDFNRRSGFADFQAQKKQFDKEREAAINSWELEQMEIAKQKAKDESEYRKSKKELPTSESGQGYKEYLETRRQQQAEYENSRMEESKRKAVFEKEKSKRKLSLTEEEEYDVYLKRPRFQQRKRALYGAKLKYGKSGSSGGSGSFSGSGSGGDSNFPSPPPFNEEFGDTFAPPPPPPPVFGGDPSFGDVPPPPPPPAFPDSFDGGAGDFVPPPPPFESFE